MSDEIEISLLRTMVRIRRFEEKIIELYPAQDMKTPVHLCIGQEAIAAGVCSCLRREDNIFSTHRNHGHYIAKGGDMKLAMAELYGRRGGCAKGKGGSMHLVDPTCGILGTTAIVGGGIPLAVGAALASAMKQDGRVSVAFFGDGAAEEGTFHESLNFAALHRLPVVFVCENNYYATNSPLSARQPHENIYLKAAGYQMPATVVDGNDVMAVYAAAKDAVERARQGKGPSLVECKTYRWKGHVGPDCDYEKGCRPKKELEHWMEQCPIAAFQKQLLQEKKIAEKALVQMRHEIDAEIDAAVAFGQASPYPDKSDVTQDVYYQKA